MKSIIQERKKCLITGTTTGLEEHHLYGGSNRKLSEKYGLKVWLTHDVHLSVTDNCGTIDVYHGGAYQSILIGDLLHIIGQIAFEDKHGSREDFRQLFGKNYL